MKTVCKKLFSLLLVAVLLVSAMPFQAFAASKITVDFYTRSGDGYVLLGENQKTLDAPGGTMVYHVAPTVTAPGGMKFLYWVKYTPGMSVAEVNAAPKANLKELYTENVAFAPAFALDNVTISFNTGYADIPNPASLTVVNGQAFASAGSMPWPAANAKGHKFDGWNYNGKTLNSTNWATELAKATNGEIKLNAIWKPTELTVKYFTMKDNADYTMFGSETVAYGGSPKEYLDFDKRDLDTKTLYEFQGWKDEDGNPVNPSTMVITKNTNLYARYFGDEVTLTLNPRDGHLDKRTKTIRIGEKIGAYGGSLPTPYLTNYVFMGWVDGNGNQVTDDDIFWNTNSTTLYATWAEEGDVRLLVYKEGDLTTPIVDRMITGGVRGGKIDTSKIDLGSYLTPGNTYKKTGYFNQDGWTEYLNDRIVRTQQYIDVPEKGVANVYVVVSVTSSNNNNTGSGSNNTGNGNNTGSNKPADPTNPATGDNSMIFTSMTVMTLAAAALVVVMQLRKRKMI